MARRTSLFFSLVIWMLGAVTAYAGDGLRQNAAGAYVFSCSVAAPGTPKLELYNRVSSLFKGQIMESDHWFTPGDEATDSIRVPLTILLAGNADMRNQAIDCDAKVYFENGLVRLKINRLVWSGQNAETRKTFRKPLSRLYEMPREVQLRTLIDADNYLWDLSVKLNAAVTGIIDESENKTAEFQTVSR